MKKQDYKSHQKGSPESLVGEPMTSYFKQPFDLIQLSRKGILKAALFQLADKFSFTLQELSRVLHVSERTLQRYKENDYLSSDTSERALLLSQLYQRGMEVFDTSENFNDWLRTPLPAFQQQAPLQFLDTAFGFQLIADEMGRIEYGIF